MPPRISFGSIRLPTFPRSAAEDPVSGSCECHGATYALSSGDLVTHDTVYTRNLGVTSAYADPLLIDCIRRATGQESLQCTGDPCGCCLLLPQPPAGCGGLPGMTSPAYPDGYCVSLP